MILTREQQTSSEKKSIPVTLHTTRISHGLTRASALKGWRLTGKGDRINVYYTRI
jgi:hypothetical protein